MATKSQKYRVYRIDEKTRKAVAACRKANNVPTRAVLESAVTGTLPKVVSALQAVGFSMVIRAAADRINPDGHYSADNVQFLPWLEHCRKSGRESHRRAKRVAEQN